MSPRQCAPPDGGFAADDVAGGEDAWPAADRDDVGGAGPLDLIRFATERMREHGTWVQAMETAAYGELQENGDYYDRDTRRVVLDSLVIISHVAHCFLRHRNADVRAAAETLTTGTAVLIGRMYHTAAVQFHPEQSR